jgi:hypothetical protein
MNYLAAFINKDGDFVRDNETAEVMNLSLGEFERRVLAIESAKISLQCEFEINGVFVKGNNQGGFLLCDTQEFAQL